MNVDNLVSGLFAEAIIKAKKKEIKRDHTAQLLSLVDKDALTEFLKTDEFQAEWKKKTRELLTEHVSLLSHLHLLSCSLRK